MKNIDRVINRLKKFPTGSFAVWPEPLANLKGINSRLVVVGLNPSARVKFGENFHKKGSRFDSLYSRGFSKEPFKAAYMTDLISHHEPSSAVIIKKWKNKKFRETNIANLRKQFKILGVKKSTSILCIGANTEKLFTSSFPRLKNVFKINNPNGSPYRVKGMKKLFLHDLDKIGKRIANS